MLDRKPINTDDLNEILSNNITQNIDEYELAMAMIRFQKNKKDNNTPDDLQKVVEFVEGEIVNVTVDPIKKIVTWAVNNEIRAKTSLIISQLTMSMLADVNKGVPCAQLLVNGAQNQNKNDFYFYYYYLTYYLQIL